MSYENTGGDSFEDRASTDMLERLREIAARIETKMAEHQIMNDRTTQITYRPMAVAQYAIRAHDEGSLTDSKIVSCAHMMGKSYFQVFFPDQSEALSLYSAIAHADFGLVKYDENNGLFRAVQRDPTTGSYDAPRELIGDDVIEANLAAYQAEVDVSALNELELTVYSMIATEVLGVEMYTEYLQQSGDV